MFGESDSESPRSPSPWDSLSTPSSSPVPKLVPEVEEGNVEYKLQLLSPTPARFARLVTQLKWRLLEGGGQAYYELGVADSGLLVGLPRQQLEESLETLEMMAGEISASVIVVKEIQVPPELAGLAESRLERWESRKSTRRKDTLRVLECSASPTTSTTEFETELWNTDVTDAEESTTYSPITPPLPLEEETSPVLRSTLPVTAPLPLNPALAVFTMNQDEDVANYADNEGHGDMTTDRVAEFSINLEISSVYKPLPMKKRATHIAAPPSTHFPYTRKKLKNGHPPSKSTDTTYHTGDPVSHSCGTDPQPRKRKRDKRAKTKPNTLPTEVPARCSNELVTNPAQQHAIPSSSSLVPNPSSLESPPNIVIESPTGDVSAVTVTESKEPKLIVEALVVRKLSLDEAFLDFEGFSLQ